MQFISDDGNLSVFIENKYGGNIPTKEQQQFIDFINAKNSKHLKAGVARNVEDALKLIGR